MIDYGYLTAIKHQNWWYVIQVCKDTTYFKAAFATYEDAEFYGMTQPL